MYQFLLGSLLIGGVSLVSAFVGLPAQAQNIDEIQALEFLQPGLQGTVALSSQRNRKVQELIDTTYRTLLLTPFGHEVVQRILNCSPGLITKHLGISQNEAYGLSRTICSGKSIYSYAAEFNSHPWIYSLPDEDIDKVVSLRQKNNRSYQFRFFENGETLPLDSWTDFKTQTTTIYLPNSLSISSLKRKLLFVLAHETAIYFDQKSQLSSALWVEHPDFRRYIVTDWNASTRNDLDLFLTAANNPLISQILSYIRAFRVEEFWMKQVPDSILEDMSIDLNREYSTLRYPFLDNACGDNCLRNYLLSASMSLTAYSLPLLANSRYWSMKVLEISSLPPSEDTRRVRTTLIDDRSTYVTLTSEGHSHMVSETNPELIRLSQDAAAVFNEILIPQDLQTLFQYSLAIPPQAKQQSVSFLTIPSLGNFGVEMAAGPRPRIRTGSSYSLDISDLHLIDGFGEVVFSDFETNMMKQIFNPSISIVLPPPYMDESGNFNLDGQQDGHNPYFNLTPSGPDDDPAN